MFIYLFETVPEFVGDILIALAPNQGSRYVWYTVACVLLIVACSGCIFIAESLMISPR
jgi:hypothetical protein